MNRLLLVGHGRMGQLVEQLAPSYGFALAGIVTDQDPDGLTRDHGRVDVAIDFTLSEEHQAIRDRVHEFVESTIKPAVAPFGHREEMTGDDRRAYITALIRLRGEAKKAGLWLPHMPEEWGGMGLGHVSLAMVQAEAAKTRVGPWVLNCQAPDEGNMHTLLHWACLLYTSPSPRD